MQHATSNAHAANDEASAESFLRRSITPETAHLYQQNPTTPMASRSRPLLNMPMHGEDHNTTVLVGSPGAVMAPPQSGISNLGKRRHHEFAHGYHSPPSPAERASKRATPDPSFAAAPPISRRSSDSSLSLDIDEGTAEALAGIIGYDPRDDKRRFKREQKNALEGIDAPLPKDDTQLQADEEYARRLQEEWNGDLSTANKDFHPTARSQLVSHEQSYLDNSGQIRPSAYQASITSAPLSTKTPPYLGQLMLPHPL